MIRICDIARKYFSRSCSLLGCLPDLFLRIFLFSQRCSSRHKIFNKYWNQHGQVNSCYVFQFAEKCLFSDLTCACASFSLPAPFGKWEHLALDRQPSVSPGRKISRRWRTRRESPVSVIIRTRLVTVLANRMIGRELLPGLRSIWKIAFLSTRKNFTNLRGVNKIRKICLSGKNLVGVKVIDYKYEVSFK